MGNLSFIVPTKNIEDFNREKIYQLLLGKFPDLTIENSEEWDSIQIRDKNDNLVEDLYFNQDCYILDYDRDIDELKKNEISDNLEESGTVVVLKPKSHLCKTSRCRKRCLRHFE
mgnify:CR=1 FL=1